MNLRRTFLVGTLCLLFLPTMTSAQGGIDLDASFQAEAELEATLPELPDPGLTPSSPFFILEQLVETVGDALTFNPEAKAKRQTSRALERIAEVKAMLADKGVSPRGLDVAMKKIEEHAAKATLSAQDPTLAKEIDRHLEAQHILLKKIIEEKKHRLHEEQKERKDALRRQLTEKLLTRADEEARELENELTQTDIQEEEMETLLEEKLDSTEQKLEEHERLLEESLDDTDRQRETFERNIRAAVKEQKKEFHAQIKDLRRTLKEKEHALKEQLKEAIILGDDAEIEHLTQDLTSPTLDTDIETYIEEASSLATGGEAVVEASMMGNADADFTLLMQREQAFLDHIALGSKRLTDAKEKAREGSFGSKRKALELKGKRLGAQIIERREECLALNAPNLGQCIAERAKELQNELEDVAVEEKILTEEESQLSQESTIEEQQFDQGIMLRRKTLDALRSFNNVPDRLLDEAQKLEERAQAAREEWQNKMELLKEERRSDEEALRERMKEGKETIRTEWQEFLKTDFTPEELKALQEQRRIDQKDILDTAKEDRAMIREEFKEGMGEVKEERQIMKEETDEAAAERSEKQRLKEEEMRLFLEKREQLLEEQRKEMEEKTEETRRMMEDKRPPQKGILPVPEKPYPPESLYDEDLPMKSLKSRYPSRDVPDRRPEQPMDEKPSAPKRPTDENPPPTKRDDDRSGNVEGRGEVKGEDGVQFEFEGKGGMER